MINLGILAHVDAGKTTLTEQILLLTGAIRKAGSVDGGDAHTDTLEVERRRGISVKSASASVIYNGTTINIIDTPGHMDFSSEIERALVVLETAVIIVSAVEGVQSQTEVIYKAIKSLNIPSVFFINKIDRMGADVKAAVNDIETCFDIKIHDYNDKEALLESLCEHDDKILSRYLDVGFSGFAKNEITSLYKTAFQKNLAIPYLTGSAINGAGVLGLLDLITEICPRFYDKSNGQLSGIIYKIEHDKKTGRLSHVKLSGGELKNRDIIHNHRLSLDEKVVQIKKYNGVKAIDTGILKAGETGIVTGLSNARVYDVIGDIKSAPKIYNLAAPLLKTQVIPKNESEFPALVAAVTELYAEDPLLDMQWVAETRELVLSITGLIQMEILKDLLQSRYLLDVNFQEPTVIYKETPTTQAEGYDAYTMPKPCWAVLRFLIEPAERGSGVIYKSIVSVDKIARAYQAQVEQALPEALKQGPLGWEATDLKITLIDGEDHVMHTHPLDFIVATPMAIMKGLVNAKTTLLEPFYRFTASVPEDMGGKIMNEIILMRGEYDNVFTIRDKTYIEGKYPVSEGIGFSVKLASMTGGRGSLSLDFGGYDICPEGYGKTTPYRGINPLDRAKYILWVRRAL